MDFPLTRKLEGYLKECPENFRLFLTKNLQNGKLSLARAVEAARRMAAKDSEGAWKFLRNSIRN